MAKKSFFIILGLSVITTYIATFVDALISNTLLAGEVGFPVKFSRGTMFGEGTTDYLLMMVNITIWFLTILLIWKLRQKIFNK